MYQPVEGTDFELVPVADDPDGWEVRLLTGPCPETVIRYANVQLDGRGRDDVLLKYGFVIISSPTEDANPGNQELQAFVGDVLHSIIRQGFEDGTLLTKQSKE